MSVYPLKFLIPLPRVDILFIHLGPLEVTGYGLMMMVAFLMAGWAIQTRASGTRCSGVADSSGTEGSWEASSGCS